MRTIDRAGSDSRTRANSLDFAEVSYSESSGVEKAPIRLGRRKTHSLVIIFNLEWHPSDGVDNQTGIYSNWSSNNPMSGHSPTQNPWVCVVLLVRCTSSTGEAAAVPRETRLMGCSLAADPLKSRRETTYYLQSVAFGW